MQMIEERIACAACHHEIDAAAKLCPYCGADPRTGEKFDTQAIVEEVFRTRQLSTSENVIEYARQRQGVVLFLGIAAGLLLLFGLHQFVTHRNETKVSNAAAVPLAEVTDVGGQGDNAPPPAMPDLQFQYDGHPQTMRTFVVEPGAVTPPEVIAAQQAAAQEAAAKAAAAKPPVATPAAAPTPHAPQPTPQTKH